MIYVLCWLYQQDKSSSSVKLPNIEKKGSAGGDDGRERFHARNWKALSKKEIQKLPPQQRSKYLAVRKRSLILLVNSKVPIT